MRRMVKDSRGRIWIGTDQGLAQFDEAEESFTLLHNATRTEDNWANVYDMKEMADGHLWIATDVGGVLTDDGRRIETSSMNTRCILQDDYQNIWIGNHSTGVDFIPKRKPLFEALDVWDDEHILAAMTLLVERMETKNAKVMWPVRIAAAGKAVTPGGAVEICRILGKAETLRRLNIAIEKLS